MQFFMKDDLVRFLKNMMERLARRSAQSPEAGKLSAFDACILMRATLHVVLPAIPQSQTDNEYPYFEGFFTIGNVSPLCSGSGQEILGLRLGIADGWTSDGRRICEVRFWPGRIGERPSFDAVVNQAQGYGEKSTRVARNFADVNIEMVT